MMFVGLILLPVLANQAQAQIFRLPEARACEESKFMFCLDYPTN